MLPEAAGRGQHFQARGHIFSLYGPTLSRPTTYFYLFFLAVNWLTSGFVYATLPLNRLTRRVQTICKKSNERVNQILYKERCIKEQICLELLYVSAFSSLAKVSKTVFPL